jgi:hypothetical protein
VALHAVTTRPVRLSVDSADLRCRVSRIVAYRAVCSCGWRGSSRSTHREAAVEGRAHVHDAGVHDEA